jgi:hypothetical protein
VAKPDVNKRPTGRRIDRSAARELQRREQQTRDNLTDFIKSVAVISAEIASAAQLDDKERSLLRRHGEHFSHSVGELIAILADHPYAHVREHRLFNLWQALGSVSFIANRWTERIEKRIKLESAARATAAKKAATAKNDEVIIAVAGPLWRKHPSWKPWRVAGENEISEQLNKRLSLKRRAIAEHLKRLRPNIFSPGYLHERPIVQ